MRGAGERRAREEIAMPVNNDTSPGQRAAARRGSNKRIVASRGRVEAPRRQTAPLRRLVSGRERIQPDRSVPLPEPTASFTL
jgi:hypothetical protein